MACGLSEWALRRRVAAGSLEPLGAHLPPPGRPTRERAPAPGVGLLDLGEEALVAGRSAAYLLGLDGCGLADPSDASSYLGDFESRRTVGTVRSVPRVPLIDRTAVDGFRVHQRQLARSSTCMGAVDRA